MGAKNVKMVREWIGSHYKEGVIALIIFVSVVAVIVWNQKIQDKYEHYNNTDISYVKGIVTETDNGELITDETDKGRYLGLQKVEAKVLSGEHKGETVLIDNYLTASSNVFVERGVRVILSQDEPEGANPYFLIYNYYRSPMIYGIACAFFAFMIIVGGWKGVRAMLGLSFTLFMVVMWMIPMIYLGNSPSAAAVATVVVTTAVTLVLLNGLSRKTLAAVIGTALGVLIVGLIFAVCSGCLHLSGYNLDETDFMVLISKNTHLRIRDVLFAGVLIASLGAVMDVGMSIASAIYEIHEADRNQTVRQLFKAGLNVGRDMIGTMSNTLILAFTGSGLATLLVLTAYGIKYHEFVSSDFLAVEIGQGLSGTMAVIMTVPVTSVISAVIYKRGKKVKKK